MSGVAESHRSDFVEIVLFLFASILPLEGFSICVLLEKATENGDSFLVFIGIQANQRAGGLDSLCGRSDLKGR